MSVVSLLYKLKMDGLNGLMIARNPFTPSESSMLLVRHHGKTVARIAIIQKAVILAICI